MEFLECDQPATNADVDAFERRLGFPVPAGIRWLLTTANGGRPCPEVFQHLGIAASVSECLALRKGRGSIDWTYDLMIVTKRAAPMLFLPFAIDPFGNLFLVDCSSTKAPVSLLTHDPVFELHSLGVDLEQFWEHLS